jgi:misacylated tRNA(Ala) deacylase
VVGHTDEGGIILDRTIFYARGGGQPGDSGTLDWSGGRIAIATAVKGEEGAIVLIPAEPGALPPVGTDVDQRLDWDRRYGHMRIHTALHLLSVVIPLARYRRCGWGEKGRLDFDMPEAPQDREVLEGQLNALVTRDLPVSEMWISEEELDANPGFVKTLSVQPPRGAGGCASSRSGRATVRSTCNPAAAPMCCAPARSESFASRRSRKRAARTAA